jgi:YrbI family 3-deoxy-D-manno-octulosonate 8-phosphate phosphatase
MFQKLRTDLVKKLAGIRLILVNADGFIPDEPSAHWPEGLNGVQIKELMSKDVDFIAFSKSKSQSISSVAEQLGIVLHQGISENSEFYSEVKFDYTVSDGEVAFICRDVADIPVMKKVNFTAVTPDAALKVKAESYFTTYCSGSGAVSEVAALILKAKKYPGGWSE